MKKIMWNLFLDVFNVINGSDKNRHCNGLRRYMYSGHSVGLLKFIRKSKPLVNKLKNDLPKMNRKLTFLSIWKKYGHLKLFQIYLLIKLKIIFTKHRWILISVYISNCHCVYIFMYYFSLNALSCVEKYDSIDMKNVTYLFSGQVIFVLVPL